MKFFKCNCYSEGMIIEKYEDLFLISFWCNEFNTEKWNRNKERRRIKKFIRKHGHPFVDNLVFDKDKLKEIADYIYQLIEENEKEKNL